MKIIALQRRSEPRRCVSSPQPVALVLPGKQLPFLLLLCALVVCSYCFVYLHWVRECTSELTQSTCRKRHRPFSLARRPTLRLALGPHRILGVTHPDLLIRLVRVQEAPHRFRKKIPLKIKPVCVLFYSITPFLTLVAPTRVQTIAPGARSGCSRSLPQLARFLPARTVNFRCTISCVIVFLKRFGFGSVAAAARRGTDRSDWITRALKNNPAVEDIRDRLSPLARAVSFAELYNKGRGRATMPPKLVVQLVLQYLDREGLKGAQRSLEKECGTQLEIRDVEDARLLTLLQTILRDVDQLWDLTIHDKDFLLGKLPLSNLSADDEKEVNPDNEELRSDPASGELALKQALEEALSSMRLMRDDSATEQADVNIWEEPAGNIIFESDEKAAASTSSPPSSPRGFVPEGTAVVAGSLNRLVEHLCPSGSVDLNYVKCFLCTYHWFCKPETLLLKLIQRYNAPREEGITESEYKRKVMSIQLRVINALREWVSAFFEDLDDSLLTNLRDFLTFTVTQDHPKPARTLLQIIEARQAAKIAALVSAGSSLSDSALVAATGARDVDAAALIGRPVFDFGDQEAPRPNVPKNIFSPTLSWLDIDEEELARQLTLIEFDTFYRIQTSELLQQSWIKPKLKHRAPNVIAMISRFNNVSNWMGTVIVMEDKIRNRVRVMQKLIGVAEHLRKLNNFNTLMAFVAIYGNAAIYRLKHTKAELPPKSIEIADELVALMSTDDASRKYRELLERTIGVPAIPFLGTFLTDLTFAEEGNSDTHMGMINFRKSRSLYSIISRIQQLQQKGYNLHPVHQIQTFLREVQPRMHEKELFKKSVVIEPRDAQRAQID